jgi:hypothetical protein
VSNYKQNRILAEIAKRAEEAKKAALAPQFSIEEFCFPEQIAFIRDPAQFKTGCTSRRSGKTTSCAADLIDCLKGPERHNYLYITLTRGTAKRIIWRELLEINKNFQLGFMPDNGELTLANPKTGSILYLSGAKDASEIEKFRGMSFKKVYIDECQSFRSYIRELIDDIIVPCLWDVAGSLSLIGTPGPVPAGFFYDACHGTGWSNHKWTILNNPFIEKKSGKTVEATLAEERKRKGITVSDPTYQREALGLWVQDSNSLVFKFDKSINRFNGVVPQGETIYIFGIDIGFNDADAIAVLGYNYFTNKVYLVEESVKSKQDITSLVQDIERLRAKYNPVKMVMDAGALGKKIQEEIQKRHQVPLEAADKNRKYEFIELLNDDLRTGKFKAKENTRFEEDCYLVTWDYDNPEKPVIADAYHSDITDAVLYAWRECNHFIKQDEDQTVKNKNTNEYMDQMEAKEAEAMERRLSGEDLDDNVDDGDLEFISGDFDDY